MSLNIKLSEPTMDSLKREAEKLGITPNMLARIQLCKIYGPHQADGDSKTYMVKMKNWQEIDAYVEWHGFDLSSFLNKVVMGYMKKNHLSDVQKAMAGDKHKK